MNETLFSSLGTEETVKSSIEWKSKAAAALFSDRHIFILDLSTNYFSILKKDGIFISRETAATTIIIIPIYTLQAFDWLRMTKQFSFLLHNSQGFFWIHFFFFWYYTFYGKTQRETAYFNELFLRLSLHCPLPQNNNNNKKNKNSTFWHKIYISTP